MRSVGIYIFLFFLAAGVHGQSVADQLLSNPYESVCGKPLADGRVYDYREGRISSVTKDNVLIFQQNDLNGSPKIENLRVRLAGIDSKAGGVRLNTFLKRQLVGRDVVVAGNKRSTADTELVGNVWVATVNDVSQHLLRKRLAAFAEPDYEAVSAYSVCVLKKIGGEESR